MKKRFKKKLDKTKRLEMENIKYKEIIDELQSKIKYDDYLKEENKKLIDWVQKILKEFGTTEVYERKVAIPIMKRKNVYYGEDNMRMRTETIIIPEIAISKIEY